MKNRNPVLTNLVSILCVLILTILLSSFASADYQAYKYCDLILSGGESPDQGINNWATSEKVAGLQLIDVDDDINVTFINETGTFPLYEDNNHGHSTSYPVVIPNWKKGDKIHIESYNAQCCGAFMGALYFNYNGTSERLFDGFWEYTQRLDEEIREKDPGEAHWKPDSQFAGGPSTFHSEDYTINFETGCIAPPNLTVWLEPDFFEKYTSNQEVNYSNIFPPVLNCTAYFKNASSDYPYDLDLNFTFTSSSSANPDKLLYNQTKSCQNKHTCTVILPEAEARNILPGETIKCEVSTTGSDNARKSDYITMPTFDLFIKKISPINVIEDVPLIANKPLMVRVWSFFTSNLVTNMDKDISINLISSLGDNQTISFKPMRDFDLETVKNNVRNNPSNPDKKDMDILLKVKKSEDSANFFNLTVPNSTITQINYISKVDEYEEINETDESNNFYYNPASPAYVQETDIIMITDIVMVELYNSKLKEYYHPGEEINPTISLLDDIYKQMYSQLSDLITVFPIPSYSQEILLEPTFRTKPEDFHLTPLFIDISYILGRRDLSEATDKEIVNIRDRIYRELQRLADRYSEYPQHINPVVVGFVSNKALSGADGYAKVGKNLFGVTVGYPNVVLLKLDAVPYTLAHEVAHLNFIDDSYSEGTFGKLSQNGWLLNQKTGESIHPIVNIWRSPEQTGDSILDMIGHPAYYDKTLFKEISIRHSFFDIMSDASISKSKIGITKEQYLTLMNNYKK